MTGSTDGALGIWKIGDYEKPLMKYQGHPKSIDSIVPLTDEIIATGSSDGIIRVCTIEPNQFLGVVGDHNDFPIERIRLSRDRKYLGSCSHDNLVKFWNIEYFFEEDDDEEMKEVKDGKEEIKEGKQEMEVETNQVKPKRGQKRNFWADL